MIKKELVAHKDPKSPVSETFRTLRTNIQFMNTNKRLKTLLVTSTMPGEGKSWVASNLAVTFAQAGRRVILIDADMRKGRVYSIFGVTPRPGLSNYLSGVGENDERNDLGNYLRKTEIPNLYVMPAGNIPPNPSELLVTHQMRNLLEELKRECDIVIIDGTPSKLVTDAVILSRFTDSTIVVTAHNQTKKDDLAQVVKDIKNVGGHVAGVVYNKIPIASKKYNETYYYASKTPTPKSRSEIEQEQKREALRARAAEMMNKKTEIAREETELPKAMRKEKIEPEREKTPEEKTAEVLKEFNEYLKKEKRTNNNRR